MPTKKTTQSTAPLNFVTAIRKKLGHLTHEMKPTEYLSLGDERLNSVLGDPDRGLFFGQIIEISGKQSNGKSALAIDVAALGQATGAVIHWADFERSFNPDWSSRRGLDPLKVHVYQPYVGKFGKEKEERLCTAQELLEEVEAGMVLAQKTDQDVRQMVIVDSVTAMLVEEEAEAGLTGQNMRTNQALPVMLGKLLRRWIALCGETRTIAVFINQLRTKPGVLYGDPDYTPGGNALLFYAHSRVRMRRIKGGRILQKGKVVGVKGILRNDKNKAGGIEGTEIGFKIYFDGKTSFLDATVLRGEDEA